MGAYNFGRGRVKPGSPIDEHYVPERLVPAHNERVARRKQKALAEAAEWMAQVRARRATTAPGKPRRP